MHEIPNLPFPSLHPTEQPTPQQAGDKQPEAKEAKPVNPKGQNGLRTRLWGRRTFKRFPHCLKFPRYPP